VYGVFHVSSLSYTGMIAPCCAASSNGAQTVAMMLSQIPTAHKVRAMDKKPISRVSCLTVWPDIEVVAIGYVDGIFLTVAVWLPGIAQELVEVAILERPPGNRKPTHTVKNFGG
jgi:hypothetical protein